MCHEVLLRSLIAWAAHAPIAWQSSIRVRIDRTRDARPWRPRRILLGYSPRCRTRNTGRDAPRGQAASSTIGRASAWSQNELIRETPTPLCCSAQAAARPASMSVTRAGVLGSLPLATDPGAQEQRPWVLRVLLEHLVEPILRLRPVSFGRIQGRQTYRRHPHDGQSVSQSAQ